MFPFESEEWFTGFDEKTLNQWVAELKNSYTEKELAEGFGYVSTDGLRKALSKTYNAKRMAEYEEMLALSAQGKGPTEIGRILGKDEATVRYMLKSNAGEKASKSKAIATILMDEVSKKTIIDVGEGAELSPKFFGCSRTAFDVALSICTDEGYTIHVLTVPQLGAGPCKTVKIMTLCPPGWTRAEAKAHLAEIKLVDDFEKLENFTDAGIPPVVSISSKRVYVRYAEEGGKLRDGMIQIRKGIPDLDLGLALYAQVRIGVDDLAYMKGVAIYARDEDIPEGYDIVYNSNKHRGDPLYDKVFKPFERIKATGEIDWDNPFGAAIKPETKLRLVPRYWEDDYGNQHVSPINVVNEMGDWLLWSRTLSPQFLSKQQLPNIKRQLALTLDEKFVQLEILMSLTNPAIKAKMLNEFAEKCDSDAVELKAVPYPTQQVHVLISLPSLRKDECYAPNFQSGDQVALIRYPHAGPFELVTLTVNNTNEEGNFCMFNAPDAIGINPAVAGKLSGADFDGDNAAVFEIGNGVSVLVQPQLEALDGYEPKELYPGYEGMQVLSKEATQTEMGLVTNLIADMQILGAPLNLTGRAVRHSMTIIDANKHKLDYLRSYEDNGIRELKIRYQGGPKAGAATLITRAGSRKDVPYRVRSVKGDDPETGAKRFDVKPRYYYSKKQGKKIEVLIHSTKMYETDDAYTLLSGNDGKTGHIVEIVYADFANAMKKLANEARKAAMACPKVVSTKEAREKYADQIRIAREQLRVVKANAPRERQAHLYANIKLWAKFKEIEEEDQLLDEEMEDEDTEPKKDKYSRKEKEKMRQQYLLAARIRFGAHREPFKFTDELWEAFCNGAFSPTMVKDILRYCDMEDAKKRALPREETPLSDTVLRVIYGMNDEGFKIGDIAEQCEISVGRVQKALMERGPSSK